MKARIIQPRAITEKSFVQGILYNCVRIRSGSTINSYLGCVAWIETSDTEYTIKVVRRDKQYKYANSNFFGHTYLFRPMPIGAKVVYRDENGKVCKKVF